MGQDVQRHRRGTAASGVYLFFWGVFGQKQHCVFNVLSLSVPILWQKRHAPYRKGTVFSKDGRASRLTFRQEQRKVHALTQADVDMDMNWYGGITPSA